MTGESMGTSDIGRGVSDARILPERQAIRKHLLANLSVKLSIASGRISATYPPVTGAACFPFCHFVEQPCFVWSRTFNCGRPQNLRPPEGGSRRSLGGSRRQPWHDGLARCVVPNRWRVVSGRVECLRWQASRWSRVIDRPTKQAAGSRGC